MAWGFMSKLSYFCICIGDISQNTYISKYIVEDRGASMISSMTMSILRQKQLVCIQFYRGDHSI